MQWAKDILKRTFVYDIVQRRRARQAAVAAEAVAAPMRKFYSQFVRPGDLCFDVGANLGNRTAIFLALGARVVAVEPQDQCVKVIRASHANEPRLTIVESALGAAVGEAEMLISDMDVVSSLSPEWVAAVKATGRMGQSTWDKRKKVPITTLDLLIAQHGTPAFIKIDVEGYEYEVVRGLTQPVKALSLEFTPEFFDSTWKCLDHLEKLGPARANYSENESMQMALGEWATIDGVKAALSRFKDDHRVFGDVYVRFGT